ncbi:hypothetical protein AVEN_34923-1 [Araneus ventricosus]|uniref:DM13 domain-containing protein n=1 Tax=Araneus ventricosus TaxID=182803 RepID=A0A4Y2MMV8_ARAVE|nr:hypothetical protein AVEN_34923-1 [Araneus ventricosus]
MLLKDEVIWIPVCVENLEKECSYKPNSILRKSGLATSSPYYGTEIGKFATHFHDVTGDVYAANEKILFIKNFNYDGKGADAVFWVGLTSRPDNTGFVVPPNRDS